MPVVQLLAGNVVINSFIFAMIISLLFLTFFIFFFSKELIVLVTISCLFIGGLLTIFFMIVSRIDFNFANMISLPLLFSLGVSYPVYFLEDILNLIVLNQLLIVKPLQQYF